MFPCVVFTHYLVVPDLFAIASASSAWLSAPTLPSVSDVVSPLLTIAGMPYTMLFGDEAADKGMSAPESMDMVIMVAVFMLHFAATGMVMGLVLVRKVFLRYYAWCRKRQVEQRRAELRAQNIANKWGDTSDQFIIIKHMAAYRIAKFATNMAEKRKVFRAAVLNGRDSDDD